MNKDANFKVKHCITGSRCWPVVEAGVKFEIVNFPRKFPACVYLQVLSFHCYVNQFIARVFLVFSHFDESFVILLSI